jgi:hypothetical protein
MMKLLTVICAVLVLSTSPALATVICDICGQGNLGQCCDAVCKCKSGLKCDWIYTTAGNCISATPPDADASSKDADDIVLSEDTTADTLEEDLLPDSSIIDDTSYEPEDLSPDTSILTEDLEEILDYTSSKDSLLTDTGILPKDDAIADTFTTADQEINATDIKVEDASTKGSSGSGCTLSDASGKGWMPLFFITLLLLALIRRSN